MAATDAHAAVEDLGDGGQRRLLRELAVDLDIAKLVLEQDDLVVLGQQREEVEDRRCLAGAEEASEDGDGDGCHDQVWSQPSSMHAAAVVRLHSIFAAAAFLAALALACALHYVKVVKNDVAQYPDETFPSVSAT